MQELIQSSSVQSQQNQQLEQVDKCDRYCEPPQTCNKHCTGQGTTNQLSIDDMDILF